LPHARLGLEGTGLIDAVGPGVEEFSIGDPVILAAVPNMDINGTYAEYTTLPASAVVARPSGLDVVAAAALWAAYSTAYGALIEKAGMHPGDQVLIKSASSNVGLAAIQVANQIGAVPIAVTPAQRQAGSSPRRRREQGHRHRPGRPAEVRGRRRHHPGHRARTGFRGAGRRGEARRHGDQRRLVRSPAAHVSERAGDLRQLHELRAHPESRDGPPDRRVPLAPGYAPERYVPPSTGSSPSTRSSRRTSTSRRASTWARSSSLCDGRCAGRSPVKVTAHASPTGAVVDLHVIVLDADGNGVLRPPHAGNAYPPPR